MDNKVDYIVTLVGKNPLPCYYSLLNYGAPGTKVFFVYTEESDHTISSQLVCKNVLQGVSKKIKDMDYTFIDCHKSSFLKIEDTSSKVLKKILEHCNYHELGSREVKIVVDYTGSTKAISTAFFSFFNSISTEEGLSKLKVSLSYLSNIEGIIYNSSFSEHGENYRYRVKDLIEKFNITAGDIIEVHGFGLEWQKDEPAIRNLESLMAIKHSFTAIDIYEGNVRFYTEARIRKIKQLIDSYFEMEHLMELLGGSEAILNINIIDYPLEGGIANYKEAEERFHNSLSSTFSRNIRAKVFLSFTNNFEEKRGV